MENDLLSQWNRGLPCRIDLSLTPIVFTPVAPSWPCFIQFYLLLGHTRTSPSPTVTSGPNQICFLSTSFSHAAFYSRIPLSLYLTPLFLSHLSV